MVRSLVRIELPAEFTNAVCTNGPLIFKLLLFSGFKMNCSPKAEPNLASKHEHIFPKAHGNE